MDEQPAPSISKSTSMYTYISFTFILFSSIIYLENDRPRVKDIANFVVPHVHHKWFILGVQLLESKDVTFLQSLKTQYQNSSDQCMEVFTHWLDVKKKPTWSKILAALKTESVNLPKVASYIESNLDNRVSIM